MVIRKSTVNNPNQCNNRNPHVHIKRAKQFMPFSALKGLDEALREQEIIAEENVKTETVKEDDICQTEDN